MSEFVAALAAFIGGAIAGLIVAAMVDKAHRMRRYVGALGRKFSRFKATAAVLDTSAGKYRIDITLDQHPPKTYTTRPGKPTSINISVAGISRLRIQLYAPGKLKSPLQAGADAAGGNNGGGLPGVGLGDPILLP